MSEKKHASHKMWACITVLNETEEKYFPINTIRNIDLESKKTLKFNPKNISDFKSNIFYLVEISRCADGCEENHKHVEKKLATISWLGGM